MLQYEYSEVMDLATVSLSTCKSAQKQPEPSYANDRLEMQCRRRSWFGKASEFASRYVGRISSRLAAMCGVMLVRQLRRIRGIQ